MIFIHDLRLFDNPTRILDKQERETHNETKGPWEYTHCTNTILETS